MDHDYSSAAEKSSSSTSTIQLVEGSLPSTPEISVRQAKDAFDKLDHELSSVRTLENSPSSDPEKGDEEETFDLKKYLTSVNAAQDEAGIISHHKRVAVTWKNLEVAVPGGGDSKVFRIFTHSPLIDAFSA
jgi:hypothetical protein